MLTGTRRKPLLATGTSLLRHARQGPPQLGRESIVITRGEARRGAALVLMLGHIARGALMKLADQQRVRLLGRMIYASWGWGTDSLKYSATYIRHCFTSSEPAQPVNVCQTAQPHTVAHINILKWELWLCSLSNKGYLKLSSARIKNAELTNAVQHDNSSKANNQFACQNHGLSQNGRFQYHVHTTRYWVQTWARWIPSSTWDSVLLRAFLNITAFVALDKVQVCWGSRAKTVSCWCVTLSVHCSVLKISWCRPSAERCSHLWTICMCTLFAAKFLITVWFVLNETALFKAIQTDKR
jgi:hypothetical protein